MSLRTTLKTVKFNNTFRLNDVGSTFPAGTFLVEIDEEAVPEISFLAYRRIRTMITVPTPNGWQVFTIDPQDLEAALTRDATATEET